MLSKRTMLLNSTLGLLMMLSTTSATFAQPVSSQIDNALSAKQAVKLLQDHDIAWWQTMPFPEGTFHGAKGVTRREATYAVARLLHTGKFTQAYPDTTIEGLLNVFAPSALGHPTRSYPEDMDWGYTWESVLPPVYQAGILQGDPAGYYHREQLLTRGQLTMVIARLLLRGFKKPQIVLEKAQFRDVTGGEWWAGTVWIAAGTGVMGGYADHTFRGSQPVTRNEFAVTLARLWGIATD